MTELYIDFKFAFENLDKISFHFDFYILILLLSFILSFYANLIEFKEAKEFKKFIKKLKL